MVVVVEMTEVLVVVMGVDRVEIDGVVNSINISKSFKTKRMLSKSIKVPLGNLEWVL